MTYVPPFISKNHKAIYKQYTDVQIILRDHFIQQGNVATFEEKSGTLQHDTTL